MKLNLNQIKDITLGAVRVEETARGIVFSRFTEEEETLYRESDPIRGKASYSRCAATAGVRLQFRTDSSSLLLRLTAEKCTSRRYFSFDVFVNGTLVGCLDNFSDLEIPQGYTTVKFPLGQFTKEFCLGEGVKDVCVYFPWSVHPIVEEIALDDGASLEAIRPEKKLLVYGDSITQGYDAMRPSNRYVSVLADRLGARELNKAIGGEFFWAQLAALSNDDAPDYITVAYGTNDWSMRKQSDFLEDCRSFYKTLSERYPKAKIFAITPIWRADEEGPRAFGDFGDVEQRILELTEDLSNVTVISGHDLIPHSREYYADLRLHPNDSGFQFYADHLCERILRGE